jgi:hypothetical protein
VNAAGGRVYILPAPAINHSQRPCSAVVAKIEILHIFRYTTRTPWVRIFDIVNHQKNSAARPADGSRALPPSAIAIATPIVTPTLKKVTFGPI